MGSTPCHKAIIDYAALQAEALGFSKLAEQLLHKELAAEAMALSCAAYGGWVAAVATLGDLYEEGAGVSNPTVKALLDEAYAVCDWAAEMRGWMATPHAHQNERIATMRGWRDGDFKKIRDIAEAALAAAGYSPPSE